MFGSGRPLDSALRTTTLIISNEEINDIMKIVKYLEEFSLLIKGVSQTIKNEGKEEKGGLLAMLLGILGASFSANLLTGKCTIRTGEAQLEQLKAQLELPRISNAASSFNKF